MLGSAFKFADWRKHQPRPDIECPKIGSVLFRFPDDGCQATMFYPTTNAKSPKAQAIRMEALEGVSIYSRTNFNMLKAFRGTRHFSSLETPLHNKGDEKFPVCIFSHGLGGTPEVYSSVCADLCRCKFSKYIADSLPVPSLATRLMLAPVCELDSTASMIKGG
jgi:hypothetical protein